MNDPCPFPKTFYIRYRKSLNTTDTMIEPPADQKMDLICMDPRVFRMMFEELVEKVKQAKSEPEDPWVSTEEALQLLRISSKTTLKKFCDEGHIKTSQLTNKLVLYQRKSILAFIEKRSKNPKDGER